MRNALLASLCAFVAGCAGAPATTATTTRPATPVCVVSVDGGDACPEAVEPIPESNEPCVERRAEGFNHGPMARVHAFCTPAESARRAAKALRKEEQD